MKTQAPAKQMPRRDFIKDSAGVTALVATGSLASLAPLKAAEQPNKRHSIGIQVGAVSFVDEGTDRCSISCRSAEPWTRFT